MRVHCMHAGQTTWMDGINWHGHGVTNLPRFWSPSISVPSHPSRGPYQSLALQVTSYLLPACHAMPQSLDTRELGLGRDFRLVRLRQLDPASQSSTLDLLSQRAIPVLLTLLSTRWRAPPPGHSQRSSPPPIASPGASRVLHGFAGLQSGHYGTVLGLSSARRHATARDKDSRFITKRNNYGVRIQSSTPSHTYKYMTDQIADWSDASRSPAASPAAPDS